MNTYALFDDFSTVVSFVLRNLRIILSNFYENPRFNFLFNMALLPVILFFIFEIIMSLILSFRVGKLYIFNVFSFRSWNNLKFGYNQNRLKVANYSVRYTAPTSLGTRVLKKFKTKKVKDIEGKVFKKDYVDWKNSMSKNLSLNNMLLRTLIDKVNYVDKEKKNKSK